jgi:hypothetical protein
VTPVMMSPHPAIGANGAVSRAHGPQQQKLHRQDAEHVGQDQRRHRDREHTLPALGAARRGKGHHHDREHDGEAERRDAETLDRVQQSDAGGQDDQGEPQCECADDTQPRRKRCGIARRDRSDQKRGSRRRGDGADDIERSHGQLPWLA